MLWNVFWVFFSMFLAVLQRFLVSCINLCLFQLFQMLSQAAQTVDCFKSLQFVPGFLFCFGSFFWEVVSGGVRVFLVQ